MTMLEIFESKLPEGVKVIERNENNMRYFVTVGDGEYKAATFIPKRCEPDKVDDLVECCIASAMMALCLNHGDVDGARKWLK